MKAAGSISESCSDSMVSRQNESVTGRKADWPYLEHEGCVDQAVAGAAQGLPCSGRSCKGQEAWGGGRAHKRLQLLLKLALQARAPPVDGFSMPSLWPSCRGTAIARTSASSQPVWPGMMQVAESGMSTARLPAPHGLAHA